MSHFGLMKAPVNNPCLVDLLKVLTEAHVIQLKSPNMGWPEDHSASHYYSTHCGCSDAFAIVWRRWGLRGCDSELFSTSRDSFTISRFQVGHKQGGLAYVNDLN